MSALILRRRLSGHTSSTGLGLCTQREDSKGTVKKSKTPDHIIQEHWLHRDGLHQNKRLTGGQNRMTNCYTRARRASPSIGAIICCLLMAVPTNSRSQQAGSETQNGVKSQEI